MNFFEKKSRPLVVSVFIGFVIIIGIELPLFNNALKGKEKDFNDKLFFTVASIEEQLLKDSVLIQHISGDSTMISLLQTKLKLTIDSVFLKNNIPIEYVLAAGKVRNEAETFAEIGKVKRGWNNNNLIWSDDPKNNSNIVDTRLKIAYLGSHPNKIYYVKIFFPYKQQFLLRKLFPEIITMALMLIILFICFLILFSVTRKQRQIAHSRNDFISNMTHELKTPLFTISIATKMLAEQDNIKGNKKYLGYLETIREEVARLLGLANKVLETSETDQGKSAGTRVAVNVHAMVENASSRLELLRAEQGATIEMRLNAMLHQVSGSETNLENVFINIIENAIKYSGKKARIIISTRNEKNNILISITDNGTGFDPALKELVFERFFRANTGNIHNVKGYGIGLSFAKSVIASHNGVIKVNTVLGQGSKFTVILPTINQGNE